jgi:anti-sigma regulatory factor (Ser/Thr protein kinase)
MVARQSWPARRAGFRWLIPAAEMAGLANGRWRASPDPALARWPWPPRIATRALPADAESVRAARDFTVATLHRWGMAERSSDIAIVVSELLTNALRHALPGPGDTGPRQPIRLGLLQPGSWVLCAVGDPGRAAPALRTLGSLDETGRGLHIICALSDRWGCTAPSQTGKVVWALFCPRLAPSVRPGPAPQARPRPVREPGRAAEPTSVNDPSPVG